MQQGSNFIARMRNDYVDSELERVLAQPRTAVFHVRGVFLAVKLVTSGTCSESLLACMEKGVSIGDFLKCVHLLDDPRGCGFGPHCRSCPIAHVLMDTICTACRHEQVAIPLDTFVEGRLGCKQILVSTIPADDTASPTVFLRIEHSD